MLVAACGSPSPTQERQVAEPQRSLPTAVLDATGCSRDVDGPFVPLSVTIPGVTRGSEVLALPRDSHDVPGTPPVTAKAVFAWDAPGVKPGRDHGNVLLNTHTWPDGSAMGNRLLDGLEKGDRVVLYGGKGQRLCYRVTERTEVLADDPAAAKRAYDGKGKPQVVIIVCSGKRVGPGHWTHRTLWFASPVR